MIFRHVSQICIFFWLFYTYSQADSQRLSFNPSNTMSNFCPRALSNCLAPPEKAGIALMVSLSMITSWVSCFDKRSSQFRWAGVHGC